MRTLRSWLLRLGGMFARARRDRELAAEIASHLELSIDDNIRAGMSPVEARRQALLRFGSVESITESYRDRRGVPALENLARDLRTAARSLAQSPGFAFVIVLTLGLGIGVATAVFGLAYGVVFSPLPYAAPDELVWLDHAAPGIGVDDGLGMSRGLYTAYRERSTTLEEIGIFRQRLETLADLEDDIDNSPEVVRVAQATASVFGVLGVSPLLGRLLEPGDDRDGAGRVAVLEHDLWRRRYGGAEEIIGAMVNLDGRPTTIVGVMRPDFVSPGSATNVWLDASTFAFDSFGSFSAQAIARTLPGVTPQAVRRDLDGVIDAVKETMPEAVALLDDGRVSSRPVALKAHVLGGVERTFWVLLGSVGVVFAIAAANVGNLFLVRADGRRHEVGVRRALGASRLQVARYVFSEGVVLSLLGGAAGVVVAAVGVRALVLWAPVDIPRLHAVGINSTVLLFAAALTAAVAAALGLAPLLERRDRAGSALRDDGRTTTAGAARMRLRRAMLVGQIALALLLIVGGGLLAKSFWRLSVVQLGFDPAGLLTFELTLPPAYYPSSAEAAAFHVALLERFEALPGVTSAAAARRLPLRGFSGGNSLSEEGRPVDFGGAAPIVWMNRATEGYFETMRIPLQSGRTLERADLEHRTNAIVINEAMAELYWPGADPLEKRVANLSTGFEPVWSTVVGVVGTTKGESLEEDPQPMAWASPLGFHFDEAHVLSYALRTAVPPLSLADEVRERVREADPRLAVVRLATAQSIVDAGRAPMAFTLILLLLAATVALLLGAIGVYGVTAYVVRQRVGEIGVRMALGARGVDVRRQLLEESALLAGLGAALGLAASLGVSRLTGSLLYAVHPLDPTAHLAGTAMLLLVVFVATWIAALKATHVEPVTALRG